jgi:hypothetical protein
MVDMLEFAGVIFLIGTVVGGIIGYAFGYLPQNEPGAVMIEGK